MALFGVSASSRRRWAHVLAISSRNVLGCILAALGLLTDGASAQVVFTASYSGDTAFPALAATVTVIVMAAVAMEIPAVSPAMLLIFSVLLALLGVRERRQADARTYSGVGSHQRRAR